MKKKTVQTISAFVTVCSLAILMTGCGSSDKKKEVRKQRTVTVEQRTENTSKNTEKVQTTTTTAVEKTKVSTSKKEVTTMKKKTEATTTETPIATKKDEHRAAVKATVTYNGFSDTNSVEMKMSDGSYEVMIVEKEDLIQKLEGLDPGTKVTIQYKAKVGQANKQIIGVL